jgi:glutamine amidotransferase
MCELLAMSAHFPTTIHLSLDELARHGGGTGPHRDGWGIGFMADGDALVVREPGAASESAWVAFLQQNDLRSAHVLAHIRRATQGNRALRNTQPFTRELGGRAHLFVHNGMLPGIEDDPRLASRRFRRIGDTDSEQAFCALLDRLARRWEGGVPTIEERLAEIVPFAADLRTLGPANFLYADGDAIFAHAHIRRNDAGEMKPPGLHVLCRTCTAGADGVPLTGLTIAREERQEVALLASVPLSDEPWQPLAEGEIVVLREGRVILRRAP